MSKANWVKMGIAGVVLFIALVSPAWASDPNTTVATPVFTPDGGTYNTEQNVTITCATPGAIIRYTIDGSDPNNGTVISSGGSVYVDHTLTLKAVAQKEGMTTIAGKSATYQIVVATPVFNPDGGMYEIDQTVIITCATAGATIRYTIDGSDPNNGTIIANGASVTVAVNPPTFLKAKAFRDGWTYSNVKTAVYYHYAGGSGTAQDPYQINSRAIFLALAIDPSRYNKCFILTQDIDLNGQVFTTAIIAPDTSSNSRFQGTMFTGAFDGNNHKITNFTIQGGNEYLGLFGYIGSGGVIKNLGIENFSVISGFSGYCYIGGLAGYNNHGSINNCHSAGSISGYVSVGGLIGYDYFGSISSCYSTDIVSGHSSVGGLVGFTASSDISNCYSTGAVSGSPGSHSVGGLVGFGQGSINRCYSIGSVNGYDKIGGLIGYNYHGAISNCYATGDVNGSYSVGGLVGQNYYSVSNSYSTGFVSGSADVGGMIGYNCGGVAQNSFWDTQTSGKTTSAGGTGKTTAQMQTLSTFTSAGWDFSDTDGDEADWFFPSPPDYPILFWKVSSNIVASPVFSVAGGAYTTEQNVVITCATAGATIHYTTTGVDPIESDPIIASGDSVYIDHGLTLKARAWKGSMTPSSVKSATYQLVVATPAFTPDGGTYNTEKNVVITCATVGATIRYTIDGSDPNTGSIYEPNSILFIDHSLTLKAKAWKGSMTPSNIKSATYQLVVATPAFSVAGGTYNTEQSVVITCATSGAAIHYTTNGLDPTESDLVIASGSSVLVDHSLTLKAKGWKGSMTSSSIKSATYQIVVATPAFTPDGGTYNTEKNVVITCATVGATIHYTTTGVDPTESDPVVASGSSVLVDHTLTLKARAWKGAMTPSGVKSAAYTLVVATPTFSKSGGTYNTEQTVTITCATSEATIHYTTTGVDPTESDPVIASGSSVTVDRTMTLKARAWKGAMTPSGIKSATYQIVVATPVFTPAGGTYNTEKTVVITCATSGATIRYTLDGSDPNSGAVYDPNTPIYVDHTLILKARAWKGSMTPSGIRSATYQIVVAMPVFNPDGGTYNTEQNVTITCATPEATIRYTLDGSDPNEGTIYEPNSPLVIDHSLTLKAKAWKEGWPVSSVKSATYQIVVATPVFTLDGGTYSTEQNVVITCATPEAAIYYTTNGIDPNESNTIIASGGSVIVSVNPPTTLKARAFREGWPSSSIKTASYSMKYSGGAGTPEDPYRIANKTDLLTLAATFADYGKYFILMADIDLDPNQPGGQVFTRAIIAPDTSPNSSFQGTMFTGTFDGNSHKISNFTINSTSNDFLGLFGYLGSGGKIKTLGITSFSVSGRYYVSGLAGYTTEGNIKNCYSTGIVSGYSYSGGLTGYNNYGDINDCYSKSSVNGSSYYTGGLTGYNNHGSINDCYSAGSVSSSSYYTGGLVGQNRYSNINNCYAADTVNGYKYVGGLLGDNNHGIVNTCYSTGAVSGTYNLGGLAGSNSGAITNSFWDTETSGRTTSVGGTGKTTAEMKTLLTFTSAGWDFNSWLPGHTGNALKFDGVDDYVEVPGYKGILGTQSRSCCAWIKITPNNTNENMILSWGSPMEGQKWMFRVGEEGYLEAAIWNGFIRSISGTNNKFKLNDGNWHHVAASLPDVINPQVGDVQLYIDGTLIDIDPTSSYNTTQYVNTVPAENVQIGSRIDDGFSSIYFSGYIDDVRIYSRALDANEIDPNIPMPTDGLVTHWAMDETGGTVAHDSVSLYDGQLYNMAPVWAICEGTNYPRLYWQIPAADWVCPDGVNQEDLNYFISLWFQNDCSLSNDYCGGIDADHSGRVDSADFILLAGNWLMVESDPNSMGPDPNLVDPNE